MTNYGRLARFHSFYKSHIIIPKAIEVALTTYIGELCKVNAYIQRVLNKLVFLNVCGTVSKFTFQEFWQMHKICTRINFHFCIQNCLKLQSIMIANSIALLWRFQTKDQDVFVNWHDISHNYRKIAIRSRGFYIF